MNKQDKQNKKEKEKKMASSGQKFLSRHRDKTEERRLMKERAKRITFDVAKEGYSIPYSYYIQKRLLITHDERDLYSYLCIKGYSVSMGSHLFNSLYHKLCSNVLFLPCTSCRERDLIPEVEQFLRKGLLSTSFVWT